MRLTNRVRRAATGLLALAPLALAACSLEDNLLEPQQPGVITPEAIENAGATGAIGLYIGAIGALKNWSCGGAGNMCLYSDLMTDVWKTSDTFTQRIDMDRRQLQTNDAEVTGRYATMTQSRGFFRDAINSLRTNLPNETDRVAEMYFALGFTELSMAEYFCNGIPLGETVNGEVRYSKPFTNVEVYTLALAHLDSAVALGTGTGTIAVRARTAAQIARGRVLVDLGRFAEAATAVSGVATSYQYLLTFAQTSGDNAIWATNYSASSTARYTVGDSASLVQEVETVVRNAIPFASSKDPRVPTTGTFRNTVKGFDGITPWVRADAYATRETPYAVVSGIDARLVEAEARLQANDVPGMMSVLNGLRGTTQLLGNLSVPALGALATPATRDAAINLFFREKAYWQFARGARLGDLRRLIRQYGRTEDQTFPEGGFHKAPFTFGNDVNFPVPDSEKTNTQFTGCIDRNA